MTTPEPSDHEETPPDETPVQRVRLPLAAWTAFGQMCKRRKMIRARHLFDLMWADIKRHGTEEEKAVFTAADKELRQRRSRKRPPAT